MEKPVATQVKASAPKKVRYAAKGRIYIAATFNNTIITITDEQGKTLCWNTCGRAGFSGTRKSTPHASTTAISRIIEEAMQKFGLNEASVYLRGAGPGREAALRYFRGANLEISKITDVTPIPHNGIRPKKKRRM